MRLRFDPRCADHLRCRSTGESSERTAPMELLTVCYRGSDVGQVGTWQLTLVEMSAKAQQVRRKRRPIHFALNTKLDQLLARPIEEDEARRTEQAQPFEQ